MPASVIVLAGPPGPGSRDSPNGSACRSSGSTTSTRAATIPRPRITSGANAGLVDWDDPVSWLLDDAMAAIEQLCREGRAEVPVYDIAHDGRTGWHTLDLAGHDRFVAEGIFAQEVVAPSREAGVLSAAYCVRQHPLVTFWRRLTRDLREHRKPPLVLVRRGLALMRERAWWRTPSPGAASRSRRPRRCRGARGEPSSAHW